MSHLIQGKFVLEHLYYSTLPGNENRGMTNVDGRSTEKNESRHFSRRI